MFDLKKSDALLIVDPQIDFFPGGALAVPQGHEIIPILNNLMREAQKASIPVFVSRDWHPEKHCSFKEQGGIWPKHCVQETHGAKFHADLDIPEDTIIVNKAFEISKESYSAFEGVLASGEPLEDYLNQHHIKRLWVGGLALDYCVKASVIGAVDAGFTVNLVLDATRSIADETAEKALELMNERGVHLI